MRGFSAHRRLWLLAAAAAYLVGVFLHLPVTDAVEWLLPRVGLVAYDRLWTAGALVLALATVTFLWWRERRTPTGAAATLWRLVPAIALAQALLVVAPIELVHYPQYAIVATLLARSGLPLEWSWLTAIALGAVDEMHQRLFLPRGTPDYFDWNDVVLNATGAALGLVLTAAWWRPEWRLIFTRRAMVVTLTAAGAAALVLAPPVISPYLTETPRHTWFRVASPIEAVVWLGVIWASVRRLARWGSGIRD